MLGVTDPVLPKAAHIAIGVDMDGRIPEES